MTTRKAPAREPIYLNWQALPDRTIREAAGDHATDKFELATDEHLWRWLRATTVIAQTNVDDFITDAVRDFLIKINRDGANTPLVANEEGTEDTVSTRKTVRLPSALNKLAGIYASTCGTTKARLVVAAIHTHLAAGSHLAPEHAAQLDRLVMQHIMNTTSTGDPCRSAGRRKSTKTHT